MWMANLTRQLGDKDAEEKLHTEAASENSVRIIIEQGVGRKAYSLKLSNLDFKFWNLAPVIGSALGVIGAFIDPSKSQIALAVAVLVAIGGVVSLIARPDEDALSSDDAATA